MVMVTVLYNISAKMIHTVFTLLLLSIAAITIFKFTDVYENISSIAFVAFILMIVRLLFEFKE